MTFPNFRNLNWRLQMSGLLFSPFSFLHQDFSYDDPKLEFNVDAPNGVVMEGYLFKRASNAFKTWNR